MKFTVIMLAVLISLVPLTVLAEDKEVNIAVDDEAIVYMGRWRKEDDGMMHGSFECGLILRFTGTGIRLFGKCSGNTLIAVDGGEVKKKTLSKNSVLYKQLENGEHTLELYSDGQCDFPVIGGFMLDAGAIVLPTQKGKIVEFIGDSITEGYVNTNDAGRFGANSYRNSYAFLLGRKLMQTYGMQFHTIAYGGIGIARAGSPDPLTMPERYFKEREYVSSADGATAETANAAVSAWDTESFIPDYLVINLGTNDRNLDSTRVTIALYSFLKKLNNTYPEALIFVMTPFIGGLTENVTAAIAMANSDRNILIDTDSWKIPAGNDNLHPAPAAHERAAELLFEALEPYIVDTPGDAPTDAPDSAATDVSPDSTGETINLVPYIVGGAVILAAAAVTAAALIRKSKQDKIRT